MDYEESVKARMVRRMMGPDAVSATKLAAETGISQASLSRWLAMATKLKGVSRTKPPAPTTAEAPLPGKRPQDWTAQERAQAVLDASKLEAHELGEFLRRRGLHREQLDEWTRALEVAFGHPPAERRSAADGKRIKELEREVARKDKALAETAALLVLKKKMALLWGAADDDTDPKSEP